MIIGLDDPDVLTSAGQERLRAAIRGIAARPSVVRVLSVLDAFRIQRTAVGGLARVNYADEAAREPARLPEIREALCNDPLFKGLLLSHDGQSTVVLIELAVDIPLAVEEGLHFIEDVLQCFESAGYAQEVVHQTGLIAIFAEVIKQTYFSIRTIFPFVAVILLVTVWLLFRRLWPALIALGVALIAVILTMGFATLLDRQINILMGAVPAIVLIISFSDIVHLCSAYLLELADNSDKETAILAAGEDVGRACLFTSLTTFVGFLSLSFVPTPVFRQLGLVLGFGVAIALLLALTLVPILFSIIRRPKPLRAGATAWIHRSLDGTLIRAERLSTRHPVWTVTGFAAVFLVSLVGLSRLRIETDLGKRLAESNPIRVDQQWFAERFAGSTIIDVFVSPPTADDLRDPEWLNQVADFQRALKKIPLVDSAHSIVDVIEMLHTAENDALVKQQAIPESRERLSQLIWLLKIGGDKELSRLVDFDAGQLRIAVRTSVEEFRSVAAVGEQIEMLGRKRLGSLARVDASGLACLFGGWLDNMLRGQRNGLLFCVSSLTVMMVLGLRSFRVGCLSMLPNLFPVIVLGGLLGGLWEQTDSDLLCLIFLAMSIGVDDTIHFLTRYRLEAARSKDTTKAIRRTFMFAGRAIVMTTVILVVGFLPFATSDYFSVRVLGTLFPVCLIAAVLADLLLVPALVQLGLIRYARRR